MAKPKAKGKKGSDPDYPTFAQAMSGPDFQEWEAAMRTELEMPCVLKFHKSLYGMNDAPLIFFELLKKNLLLVGFKQLVDIDPCLFVHKEVICLTYVDDCLWFGKDSAALDALINQSIEMQDGPEGGKQ